MNPMKLSAMILFLLSILVGPSDSTKPKTSKKSKLSTSYPSVAQSLIPSSFPSKLPSVDPSSLPSTVPSLPPSSQHPSTLPSAIPSMVPTILPSESFDPSTSSVPSSFPTVTPSISVYPSISTIPSMAPSILLQAVYDETYGAPLCEEFTSKCSTGVNLISGNGVTERAEPNHPNTLDGCTYKITSDEGFGSGDPKVYVERIDVSSNSDLDLTVGTNATIEAFVIPPNLPEYYYVDFFIAAKADAPSWIKITSLNLKDDGVPLSGGLTSVSAVYSLPTNESTHQAVRVSLRYKSSNIAGCTCACGYDLYTQYYRDDTDDLAFLVRDN